MESLSKCFLMLVLIGWLFAACTTLEIGVERTPTLTNVVTEAAPTLTGIAPTPTGQLAQSTAVIPTNTLLPAPTSAEISSSPLIPMPPYFVPTPIPAGQMRGEWSLITSAEGLCTDTPLFIGSDFIGTGTAKMCYFTDHWETIEVPQGSRVNAANRFPPGGGWSVATDVGICHFPFGEWKCQATAEGFPYAEIKSLVPLSTEAVYMLTDTVAFRSELYRIPDLVGDASARPTWINVSSEFFAEGFLAPEIWIGTNGYGVVVVQPATKNIKRYTSADGLPSNTIRDVETERCPKFCDFRDIWVATNGGVGHWDGARWMTYTTADGLPSNDVRGVVPIQRNVVWAATAKGAAYFDGQAWQGFTLADGLPVEDLQGVICCQFNNSVWFNTIGHGLVTFTPQPPQSQLPVAIAARSSLTSPLPTPMLTLAPTITPVPFAPIKLAKVTGDSDTNEAHDVDMISYVRTVGAAADVAVVDNFAYVADSEVGLQVIDISAVNKLTKNMIDTSSLAARKLPGLAMASRVDFVDALQDQPYLGRGPRAYRVVVSGKFAYVAAWNSWQIVDISDPLNLKTVSSQDDDAADIAIMGHYAYIVDSQRPLLHMADISNPAAPTGLGTYSAKDVYFQGVFVADNFLYAAAGSEPGLHFLDITDPSYPVEVGAFKTPLPAWDVERSGKYAFVVWNLRSSAGGPIRDCNSGVSIVDVSDPKAPVEVGQYCDPGREVADVAIEQNYLYVAAGRRGLRVLDISNPANPLEVGFYDTPGDAQRVTTAGSYIYVTDSGGGLFILRFTSG